MEYAEQPDQSDAVRDWIRLEAIRLENPEDLRPLASEIIERLNRAGLAFDALSVYLFGPNEALHYALHRDFATWNRVPLGENMAEVKAVDKGQRLMWSHPDSDDPLRYLCMPCARGAVTVSARRPHGFSTDEQALLAAVAGELALLVLRHQDLHALEEQKRRDSRTRAKLERAAVAELTALYDASMEQPSQSPDEAVNRIVGHLFKEPDGGDAPGRLDSLVGEGPDDVARSLLAEVTDRLGFDRGGIFLRDFERDLLRGFWGMDEKGRPEPIAQTVFPLYPERNDELTHTALIARGEEPYYLTQDLVGEGGPDFGANIAVPIRAGERITGVLAADNILTRRPIAPDQIKPLIELADRGGAALERARLYCSLREVNQNLERRIAERTTELEETNARLQEALAEKEMLFKEIHHRVKNNLQTVSSLLSLQHADLDSEEAVAALVDSEARVQAMSLIHERLYRTENWTELDYGQYARDLARDIFEMSGVDAAKVRLEVEAEEFSLSIDQAMKCSLLLNELLLNALKHAFPAGRSGWVRVAVRGRAGDEVVLEVEDNGVGIPEAFDLQKASSLGMKLIVSMTQSLRGTLQRPQGDGTAIRIAFPK